jgi:hypothetical protein
VSSEQQLFENDTGANLGFEEKLWAAADKMRSYMDPSEYVACREWLVHALYTSKGREPGLPTGYPSHCFA